MFLIEILPNCTINIHLLVYKAPKEDKTSEVSSLLAMTLDH